MAQFNVHADLVGGGLWLDCQADVLSHLNTRLVVPLMLPELAPKPAGRLNPAFDLGGKRRLMVTQYAAAVERDGLARWSLRFRTTGARSLVRWTCC